MENKLTIVADGESFITQRTVDFASGQVKEERFKISDGFQRLNTHFTPMTEALKNMIVYERKGKQDGQAKPVRLGELGPILLVRVGPSGVVNEFSARDLSKPIGLSWGTVCELHALFSSQRTSKTSRDGV